LSKKKLYGLLFQKQVKLKYIPLDDQKIKKGVGIEQDLLLLQHHKRMYSNFYLLVT